MNKPLPQGKPEAADSGFPSFYREHAPNVRGLLYRLCGERDLDDLVQEAFLRLWKKKDSFQGRSQERTWVYRVATNLGIDYLRKKENRVRWAPLPELALAKSISSDTTITVRQTLERMNSDHRAIVILSFMEGFTNQEVSDLLDIPLGTVKSRLHHARESFKSLLDFGGKK